MFGRTEPLTLEAVLTFIDTWQKSHPGELISKDQLSVFAKMLLDLFSLASIKPESTIIQTFSEKATPLFFSGNIGPITSEQIAAAASKNGGGYIYYLNDTRPGKILNDQRFKSRLELALGKPLAERLMHGRTPNGRTNTITGNILTIEDYITRRMMLESGDFDLKPIVPEAPKDSAWYMTALPAYLEGGGSKTIWGMPRAKLVSLYHDMIKEGMPESEVMGVIQSMIALASRAGLQDMKIVIR